MRRPPLSIDEMSRILVIMEQMLLEAANANWQELSRLDSERRVLLGYQERQRSNNELLQANDSLRAAPGERETPEFTQTEEYLGLKERLMELDARITRKVDESRQLLIEQNRGLQAQVSAKKSYEHTRALPATSY